MRLRLWLSATAANPVRHCERGRLMLRLLRRYPLSPSGRQRAARCAYFPFHPYEFAYFTLRIYVFHPTNLRISPYGFTYFPLRIYVFPPTNLRILPFEPPHLFTSFTFHVLLYRVFSREIFSIFEKCTHRILLDGVGLRRQAAGRIEIAPGPGAAH